MKVMTIQEVLQRIKTALKIKEYHLAEKLLLEIDNRVKDTLFVLLTLGTIYEQTRRYREAFLKFKKALSLYPEAPEVYNNLGVLYKNMGDSPKAISMLEKGISLAPKKADFHYNLGNVYKEMEQYDFAISEYEKAITLDPKFIFTYSNLGTIYEAQKRPKEAEKIYLKGLSFDPNNPRLRYNLGVLYKNEGLSEKAQNEFEEAIRHKPGWIDALNNYGVTLGNLKDHKTSIKIFESILHVDPANTKVLNNIAIEFGKTDDTEKAVSYYEKALETDPEYYNGIINLGRLYEEKGFQIEATEQFKKVIAMNPENLTARLRYASILLNQENFSDAEKQLQFILEQNPKHLKALRILWNIYIRQENYQKADEIHDRLVTLDTQNKDFYFDVALFQKQHKNLQESEESIKQYMKNNPDDLDGKLLLGELYFQKEHYQEAETIFLDINEKQPSLIKPYYYLVLIYRKSDRLEEAIKMLKTLINLQGTRTSIDDLSQMTKALELYENMLEELEKDLKKQRDEVLLKSEDFEFDSNEQELPLEERDPLMAMREMMEDENDAIYEQIIDQGLNEPLIEVAEEEEFIDLDKLEKEVVEIEEEEHTPLLNLLKNQELYEDSAMALKNLEAKQRELEARQRELEQISETDTEQTFPPDNKTEKIIRKKVNPEESREYPQNFSSALSGGADEMRTGGFGSPNKPFFPSDGAELPSSAGQGRHKFSGGSGYPQKNEGYTGEKTAPTTVNKTNQGFGHQQGAGYTPEESTALSKDYEKGGHVSPKKENFNRKKNNAQPGDPESEGANGPEEKDSSRKKTDAPFISSERGGADRPEEKKSNRKKTALSSENMESGASGNNVMDSFDQNKNNSTLQQENQERPGSSENRGFPQSPPFPQNRQPILADKNSGTHNSNEGTTHITQEIFLNTRDLERNIGKAVKESLKNAAANLKDQIQILPVPVYSPEEQPFKKEKPVSAETNEKLPADRETLAEQETPAAEKSIKDKLRDYIKNIQQKLEEKPVVDIPEDHQKKDHVIGLLDHLVKLQKDIPGETFRGVDPSEMKLKIEYLREKLAGQSSLMGKIGPNWTPPIKVKSEQSPDSVPPPDKNSLPAKSIKNKITGTLKFVRNMVNYLPDEKIKNTLGEKLDHILKKMPGSS